jgi:hypothetical protein
MKARTQAKAWLAGLVLGLMCAVCGAQTPTPAANGPAASTATASTSLPANIPLRRESDAPVVRSGQWAMAFWGLLAVGGVLWVLARRRRSARTAGQGGAGWANWLHRSRARRA